MTQVPPSRLLARLDADIAAAPTPFKADCLRAERACYLARQGQIAEARAVVTEVQQRYAQRPNVEISAWTGLAEGLMIHFTDMGPLAHDKVRRSHALSAAANLGAIRALSAAWVAQLDYFKGDIKSMVLHAAEALDVAKQNDHSSRSRACFVIAQAYHYSGRLEPALPWYRRGRDHVSADGDELTLSASMHNMAWLRAANLRQATFSPSSCIDEAATVHALLSADSTFSFESLVGSKSLESLHPMLKAQIFSIEGEPAKAVALYEEHLPLAIKQGLGWLEAAMRADLAWCRLQVDRSAETDLAALAGAEEAEGCLRPNGQPGDIAPAHSRLADVHRLLGNARLCQEHEKLAQQTWAAHAKMQNQMFASLQSHFGSASISAAHSAQLDP